MVLRNTPLKISIVSLSEYRALSTQWVALKILQFPCSCCQQRNIFYMSIPLKPLLQHDPILCCPSICLVCFKNNYMPNVGILTCGQWFVSSFVADGQICWHIQHLNTKVFSGVFLKDCQWVWQIFSNLSLAIHQ